MYCAVPSCPVVHSTEQDLLGYFGIVGNSGHAESMVHSGMYHAVPFYPMVHEDGMDSGIIMLRVSYTVGCTMLYHSVPYSTIGQDGQ